MPLQKPDAFRFLNRHVEIAASAAPSEIVIFPDGLVEVLGYEDMTINSETAAAVIANFADRGVDVPIDFEHSTKYKAGKGEPAPAAGWIKSLRYEKGEGIVASCEWNPEAARLIEGNAYKYLSPHWLNDAESNAPEILIAVALTNTPRIKNMPELIAASMAAFEETESMPGKEKTASTSDTKPTLKDEITAAIDDIAEHLGKLKDYMVKAGRCQPDSAMGNVLMCVASYIDEEGRRLVDEKVKAVEGVASIADRLGLAKTASVADIVGAIDETRKKTVDAAEYKKVTERLASLEATEGDRWLKNAIEDAVAKRKLNPNNEAQVKTWTAIAKKDREQFASLVESSPELWQEGVVSGTSVKPAGVVATRKSIIVASIGEFDANKGKIGCTRDAFINQSLREKGEKAMTADEAKALVEV